MPICAVMSGGLGLPTRSLVFPGIYPSGKLVMSDSNFGAYDRSKIAFTFSYRFDDSGTDILLEKANEFIINLNNTNNRLRMTYYVGGSTNYLETTTEPVVNTWYHFYIICDPNNITSADRLIIYVNGVRETAYASSLSATGNIDTTTNDFYLGSGHGGSPVTGKLYQFGMFAGEVPPVSYVYDSGNKDISTLVGLYSYLHTLATGSLEDDYLLTTDWTNGGNVSISAQIP